MSKPDNMKCILVCEECKHILDPQDIIPDSKWGHICRERNFRKEHRCESYILEYYTKETL